MAYEVPGFSFTLVAVADYSATQYRFIDVDANGKGITPSAAGQRCVGVRQNKPKANEAATVMASGISFVEAGAAITCGADVMSDTVGRAITAATASSAVCGVALETAGAAGVIIAVLLSPPGQKSIF